MIAPLAIDEQTALTKMESAPAEAEAALTALADQFGRHRAQRLVEAERHVPGLAGEDREDRRQFQPQHAAGEQVRRWRRSTRNREAYELWLQGWHLAEGNTREEVTRGKELAEKALEIDPNLVGVVMTVVFGATFDSIRRSYQDAELRKTIAQDI
jgi:hypothetical protein